METTSAVGLPGPGAGQNGTADSGPGALPNLIVIGAQKCGTSGLHYYLSLHPEIQMSEIKELNFFIAERNWKRGLDWYRAQFDPDSPVRGEASPNYTSFPQHRGVPKRMHATVPDAKLIYIVRDPIERIAAHWVHNFAKGRDRNGDIVGTVTHPRTSYIARSQYFMQLKRFLRVYDRDQVLIIEQNDLRLRRNETLREVFAFAGADPEFSDPRFIEERHKTKRKTRPTKLGRALEHGRDRMPVDLLPASAWAYAGSKWPFGRRIERPDVRDALSPETIELLRDDAEKLRELTGRKFRHWSIWKT